ncbi:MAG: nascent polypeptide-associated complex protein [Candidatus Micrarchaeia archaeon]
MMPKMDHRQMAKMMSQMGIKNEEVPAVRVVIETPDGRIVVENPQVTRVTMQGQASFQVAGDAREEKNAAEEDDATIVARECNCTRAEAERALAESSGDIALAIVKLKG